MRSLFIFLMAVSAFAQDRANNVYECYKETVLSAAAEVLTVQAPGSGVDRITFMDGFAYCSVAATVTVERSGTAATTTTLTPVAVSPDTPTAVGKCFSASNVGVGTVLSKLEIAANELIVIDLKGARFASDATSKNYTFRTNAVTGTCRLFIRWTEDKF